MSFIAEERQEQNAKRRKIEKDMETNGASVRPSASLNLTSAPTAPAPLPPRPDFAAKADSIGLGGPKTAETASFAPAAAQALAGSNRDIVANRHKIRLANMSAAEMLKAEMASLVPVKASRSSTTSSTTATSSTTLATSASVTSITTVASADDAEIPGLGGLSSVTSSSLSETSMPVDTSLSAESGDQQDDIDGEEIPAEAEDSVMTDGTELRGVKRSLDEVETEDAEDDAEVTAPSDEEEAPGDTSYALKVNPDGTVEQEDTVKCVKFSIAYTLSLTVRQLDYGNLGTGSGTTARSSTSSTVMRSSGSSKF